MTDIETFDGLPQPPTWEVLTNWTKTSKDPLQVLPNSEGHNIQSW